MIDGRHPDDAAPDHLGYRLVVQVGAVLDRIGPRAHGVSDAGGAVGMNRHLFAGACAASTIAFISSNVTVCVVVDALEAAARSVNLDPVRAGLDPLLGGFAHRSRVGRWRPARAEIPWTRHDHAWADHRAHRVSSRIAKSVSFDAPRSRTVVTPLSSVRLALSCARNTVTAGRRRCRVAVCPAAGPRST